MGAPPAGPGGAERGLICRYDYSTMERHYLTGSYFPSRHADPFYLIKCYMIHEHCPGLGSMGRWIDCDAVVPHGWLPFLSIFRSYQVVSIRTTMSLLTGIQ